MKLAIVGTSKLNESEEDISKQIIFSEFFNRAGITDIYTGDADGIDSLVVRVCGHDWMKRPITVFKAKDKSWLGDQGFKNRNLAIAKACDELICITTTMKTRNCYHCNEKHQRTGGCFTMKAAKKLGKPTRLYVI